MAKDAKKASREAKTDAKQAIKMSVETSASQAKFMIQYDTRLQQVEGALQIGVGDLTEDCETPLYVIGSETPIPRRARDCEKSPPPYETRSEATFRDTLYTQVQRGRKLKD